MIKFPDIPFWFEVEHDGRPVYVCFDGRDALHTVDVLIRDQTFIDLFLVDEFAVTCYFKQRPLFTFVWSVPDSIDKDIDYDSAKVFKFFDDVEVESYGGSEKS